jgi:hypothetical protein
LRDLHIERTTPTANGTKHAAPASTVLGSGTGEGGVNTGVANTIDGRVQIINVAAMVNLVIFMFMLLVLCGLQLLFAPT